MSIVPERTGVHVRAAGKINVYLGVGLPGRDGYHPLATVFQAVSLFEDVYAEPATDFSVTIVGDEADSVPTDERNLALQAAMLLATDAEYGGGVHLEIHKTVPVAGGMGGGSADAAAALVACDALWQTGFTSTHLQGLAAQLGADVPFALMGGTAIGTGRGDVLNPALAHGRLEWVLALSNTGMSTPAVYRELDVYRDEQGVDDHERPASMAVPVGVLQALRAGDPHALAAMMHNDLQVAALRLRPDLEETIARGMAAGALRAMISGSGPTVAFLCATPDSAERVKGQLEASGIAALRAHGPVPGARVVSL